MKIKQFNKTNPDYTKSRHTNQTKQEADKQEEEDRHDCLKIEERCVENFWRVLNCVAQRLCWGREKVGQKGVAAGGRVGEGG